MAPLYRVSESRPIAAFIDHSSSCRTRSGIHVGQGATLRTQVWMPDRVRHDIDCDRMVLRPTALPPRHPASLETPAVLLARHDAEPDLAEALDGPGPGPTARASRRGRGGH